MAITLAGGYDSCWFRQLLNSELWKEGRLFEKQRATLAELKAGDRVLVEPFHLEREHDHLTVVEELRKAD